MAKYTTELRSICETYAGYSEQQGLGNTSAVIQAALPKLFDFDFPIYDESYRNVLETKIVRHFYTREIGAETVGRWKLFLEDRLNMIMPYYNKLYQSELIEFNPMYDVDLTTDHSKGNEGNAESQQNRTDNIERNRTYGRKDDYTRDLKESNEYTRDLKESDEYTRNLNETDAYNRDLKETNDLTRNLADSNLETRDLADHSSDIKNQTHIDKYSDTPQGAITGLENDNYLTNARIITDNSTDEVSETHTGTVKNDGTETGTSNTTINQTGTDNRSIAQTGTDSHAIGQTGTDSRSIGQTGTDSRTITDTDDISTAQTGNTNGTSKYTDTESYLEHVKGKTSGPSYSKLLQEYRDTFINIDNMIIGQLNDLFINLW